jgi:type VI secretion system protein ImpK
MDQRGVKRKAEAVEERVDLPTLASDFLMLILQVRASSSVDDIDQLRSRVKDLLGKMEYRAKDAGVEFEQIEQAKFALVAFLDEAITGMSSAQKDSWMSNPLQMELFNRYDAGEEFFRRLSALRQRPQAHGQALEVYYLSMVLGFKGKYQYQEQEALRGLIEDTRNDLFRGRDSKALAVLSPHGKPQEGVLEVVSKEVPAWVIGVAATAIGVLFFVVMTLLIDGSAQQAIEAIQHVR